MFHLNKTNNLGVWGKYFSEPYSQGRYNELRCHSRIVTANFMHGIRDGNVIRPDIHNGNHYDERINAWVASSHGQIILCNFVQEVQHLTTQAFHLLEQYQNETGQQHLPIAHDQWQMAKDVAEALRFRTMEQPQGYKELFIIPTAFHDLGRLPEALFFDKENPHTNWIPHAEISFLMLQDILDQDTYKDMPRELKWIILHGVLSHSYTQDDDIYTSAAVKSCDRMQLIGPEGFIRAVLYVTCLKEGGCINDIYGDNLPAMSKINSSFGVLEYFARCMPPNIGDYHCEWQKANQDENLAILRSCYDGHFPRARMVTSYTGQFFAHSFDEAAIQRADNIRDRYRVMAAPLSISAYELAEKIIYEAERPSGSAKLADDKKIRLREALATMTDIQRTLLHASLPMAFDLRRQQDKKDFEILRSAAQDQNPIVQQIAAPALACFEQTYCPANEVDNKPAFARSISLG